jgi:hypothetical protein
MGQPAFMQGYVCAIPSNKTKYHTCRRYTFTFVALTFVAIKCSPSLETGHPKN